MDVHAFDKSEMTYNCTEVTDDTTPSTNTRIPLPPRELPGYHWKTWKTYMIFFGIFILFGLCFSEMAIGPLFMLSFIRAPSGSIALGDMCAITDPLSIIQMFGPLEFKTVKVS